MDADGGIPRQLTHAPSDDVAGTWSRDGQWIFFRSNRGGTSQIWKIPAEGGEAVQVTRGGGFYAEESSDGRYLYYAREELPTPIWRVPAAGGDEIEVMRGPVAKWADWALCERGLYFATARQKTRGEEFAIWFLDFASGQVTELFRKDGLYAHWFLAVSPDEEWILYAEQRLPQSELMLVENFR